MESVDPTKAALARARSAQRARGQAPSSGTAAKGRATVGRLAGSGRDPVTLGAAVDDMVTALGWSPQAAVGSLTGRWEDIVGPDVAAHVHVEAYSADDTTLVLRTDSTAWSTQMRLLLPTLMARLTEELGAGTVTSLTILGPAAPSWRSGPRTVPGRGPRDTYG